MKILLNFLVFVSFAGLIEANPLSILENSTEKIILNWEISDYGIIKNNKSDLFYFTKSNTSYCSENGLYLPGYRMFFGLPSKTGYTVNVEPLEIVEFKIPDAINSTPAGKINTRVKSDLRKEKWILYCDNRNFENIETGQVIICPFEEVKNNTVLKVLKKARITINMPSFQGVQFKSKNKNESSYLKDLLFNYDISCNWQNIPTSLKRTRKVNTITLYEMKKVYHFTIGDGFSDFKEATTFENGILCIRGKRILELFGNEIYSGQIALYGSWKNRMPSNVPNVDSIPEGLIEIPLLCLNTKPSELVKENDVFLAYVTGMSDWEFDKTSKDFRFNICQYSDNRNYYLVLKNNLNSSRMKQFDETGVGIDTLTHFANKIRYKQPTERPVHFDYQNKLINEKNTPEWATYVFKKNGQMEKLDLRIPYLDSSFPGSIYIHGSSANGALSCQINNTSYNNINSDFTGLIRNWYNSQIVFSFSTSNSPAGYYQLDYFDIHYKTKIFNPSVMQKYELFSSNDSGLHSYKIPTSKTNAYIFRIKTCQSESADIQFIKVVNDSLGGQYIWSDTGGIGVKYHICNESSFLELPTNMSEYKMQFNSVNKSNLKIPSLKTFSDATDFLIITHPQFISAADSLMQHKTRLGYSPSIIDVNHIYFEFSGGNFDPVAIRNFLIHAKQNWRRTNNPLVSDFPFYVVLFGNGHFDFKNAGFKELNAIPVPYVGDIAQDDFYTFLSAESYINKSPEIPLGRLPITDINSARSLVNKIKEIENPDADYSQWRNRALLVADDDMQGDELDNITGKMAHHIVSEDISSIIESSQPSLEQRKLYLYEYPWNSDYLKPEASKALINELNAGLSLVNYVGHGATGLWADEHILTNDLVNNLYNKGMYPLVCSFSCSVGEFDIPQNECLSEALVLASDAGAIATISSTRESQATNNHTLASSFYSKYLDVTKNYSIGTSLVLSKISLTSDESVQYNLLGDPSLKHVKSFYKVNLSILNNGKEIHDSLPSMNIIEVRGTITDSLGNIYQDFGKEKAAYVQLTLFDVPDSSYRKDGITDTTRKVTYVLPGKPIFSNRLTISSGRFEQKILIPRKVTFDKPFVKLIAYAWCGEKSAIGASNNLVFQTGNSNNIENLDKNGPEITIRPLYDLEKMSANAPFVKDKITATLPVEFEIGLSDPNGIDVVGIGPDEGLTFDIAGALARRNINHKFIFNNGDFRKGTAIVGIDKKFLQVGLYTLSISAQDLLGNTSRISIGLEITGEEELKLDHVFNSPNPMHYGEQTKFYYYHSLINQIGFDQKYHIQAHLYLYTLYGKLLKVIKDIPNGYVWDGTDQLGNRLSPNVYLYRVIAEGENNRKIKSRICKLMLKPPR